MSRLSAVGCCSSARAGVSHRRFRASSVPKRSTPVARAAADAPASADATKALKAACDTVVGEMKGVSVAFVGDNESANVAVANVLAKALGYTPLSTGALIEQVTKSTRAEILAQDGDAGLVLAENAVLEQLSRMIRTCVATCGGGKGATARGDCWDHIFGQFTVWLDDVDALKAAEAEAGLVNGGASTEADAESKKRKETETSGTSAPQRDAYAFAEISLVLSSPDITTTAEAANIAINVVNAIGEAVKSDPQLAGKKGFYTKMGCRGDWPVLVRISQ